MQLSKDKRQETLIYLVLWGLLFAASVLSLYIRTVNTTGQSFDWSEVFIVWRQFGLFFVIFLVHNHLLAPLLVYRQRKLLYFSIVAVVVALFAVYQFNTGPDDIPRSPTAGNERRSPPADVRRRTAPGANATQA